MSATGLISLYSTPNSTAGAKLAPIEQYMKYEFESQEFRYRND